MGQSEASLGNLSLSNGNSLSLIFLGRESVFSNVSVDKGLSNLESLFVPGGVVSIQVCEGALGVQASNGS